MKNVSHSPVTEMLSGKYKIFLIIGLALLPIADLGACIALWVFGAASSYWALPFLMAVADLVYLLCVVLSNQRFKYAQKLFFAYLIVTVVLFIIWFAKVADSSAVILSGTVEAACGLLHVVGIAAVGISYLYASRRLRLGRHIQLALAIIFSAVMLFVLVIAYGTFIISDGYFGQGHGNLPLVYSYTDNDECEVTDVVFGKGDSVVIPYEFNGRKVTKVSAKVFTYANIKSVTLNCDPDVELCTDSASSVLNTNISIYVDKKDADTIKQKLYDRETNGEFAKYRHELGNNVVPIGLDKDEVYVRFMYDRYAYKIARDEIIPTWYGKKGDTFKLADIEGVDYVTYSSVSSDDALYYCYDNYEGNIMTELQTADDKALDGITVNGSYAIPVSFQRIYKVLSGESNDDMYNTDDHFPFSVVNGVKQNYKLTVADKADELLDCFDRGEAFTRTMQYAAFNINMFREFTSLSALLREGYSEVTIAPYWELVLPKITLSRVNGDGEVAQGGVVYGDDYELSASVTHPLSGAKIEYEWFGVESTGNEKYNKNIVQHASSVGIKTFSAIGRVLAPDITSCTSVNHSDITISIVKRPLTVTWWMEGGGDVYDGNPRQILNEVENAADGEIVMIKGYTRTGYAGTFTENAEFVNLAQANNYSIVKGSSYTYTIKPCIVPLTWDEQTEFVYDRKNHRPEAHATDLSGQELALNYSGTGTWVINAGEYSVTAEIQSKNYAIDDASKKTVEFKITPKPVTVAWSIDTQLVYNGNVQAPEATSIGGVDGETVAITVTGGQRNANTPGTSYTAVATSANRNYTLTGSTTYQYTIEPYPVAVTWTNTTLTYNGKSRLPNASAVGVNSQIVPVTVTTTTITGNATEAVNAGSYTATATVADTNYTIKSGATHAFTINKMTVRAEWSNTTLTYNGTAQAPTATAKGVNGEDLPLTVTGARKDVGTGTATATFASVQQNYTLTNATQAFTIARKTLNVTVNDVTVAYGQQASFDIVVDGIVAGDDVTVVPALDGYTPDENGTRPAGEYEISAGLSGSAANCYVINIVRKGTLTVIEPSESTED